MRLELSKKIIHEKIIKYSICYVLSEKIDERIFFICNYLSKHIEYKNILFLSLKQNIKECTKYSFENIKDRNVLVINFEFLNKYIMNKDFPKYRIESKKEVDMFCDLPSNKVKPIIFGEAFSKPDILICDSAFKLGSFPKLGKQAALVKTLTKNIPVIASGFSIHPSGKNVKLFNQTLAFNKTRYKNFNEFSEDNIIKKMININGYKGTDYSRLSVNGIKWYNNFINKCVIDLSNKKEKIDSSKDIIHTIDMPDIIREKLEKVNNMKPFIVGRYYFNVVDESDKRKKIAQLSSGTIKLKDKRYIIDNSKVKFINEHYGDKRIIIFCVYDEEEKMLNEYFSRKKNVLVTKFKNEYFIKEDYEYAIFLTLTENTLRYHETLVKFNDLKKVYIFFKGGFNQKIYRKMIMKIGNM